MKRKKRKLSSASGVAVTAKRNVTYAAPDYRQDISRVLSLSLLQESFPPYRDHDESTAASRLIPLGSSLNPTDLPSVRLQSILLRDVVAHTADSSGRNGRRRLGKICREDRWLFATFLEPNIDGRPVGRGPKRNEGFQARGKNQRFTF